MKNKRRRQERSLIRLENQLKAGVKPEKIDGKTTGQQVELEERDVKRIQKEITNLKTKL